MPPSRSVSVKHKTRATTTVTTAAPTAQSSSSPATSTAPEGIATSTNTSFAFDFPLPAPSTSTSHSISRILRSLPLGPPSSTSLSHSMKRIPWNSKRFNPASRVLVPAIMNDRRVAGATQLDALGPQPMTMEPEDASETIITSSSPRTRSSNALITSDDIGILDTIEAAHPQPRILVPSSSSPPREEEDGGSNINITREPPPKRRRRTYSIRDESSPPPPTTIASTDRTNDVVMALKAEFNAIAASGPALGEPSSSKRRISVPSSSKKREVNLVSSRSPSPSPDFASSSKQPAGPEPEPLSTYVCPICLSPPTNTTLTPCGHICCGECLFTAVRSALQRAAAQATREPVLPRCPVCRAVLKDWDGRGRGVIGLKPRVTIAL